MFAWIRKTGVGEWADKRNAENILRRLDKDPLPNEKVLNEKLVDAVNKGMPETVKALVKAGAGADAQIYYEHGFTNYSYAVISRAAARGNHIMVKALVEAGANINKTDTYDNHTPLIEAVRTGNAATVRLLLDLGADPEIRTNIYSKENVKYITPTSPQEIAERHGFVGIAKMLKDEPARRRQVIIDAATAAKEAEERAKQEAAAAALALSTLHPSVTETGQDIEINKPLQIKKAGRLFR